MKLRAKIPLDTLPLPKVVSSTFVAALILLALSALVINFLPPEIPLFYLASQDKSQIAPSWKIIFPGILAVGVSAVNVMFALKIKSDFLKKTLITTGFAITALSVIAVGKIFFLVASL